MDQNFPIDGARASSTDVHQLPPDTESKTVSETSYQSFPQYNFSANTNAIFHLLETEKQDIANVSQEFKDYSDRKITEHEEKRHDKPFKIVFGLVVGVVTFFGIAGFLGLGKFFLKIYLDWNKKQIEDVVDSRSFELLNSASSSAKIYQLQPIKQ